MPVDPGGGQIAELTFEHDWLRADHFASAAELDEDTEPQIFSMIAGDAIDADALRPVLLSAKEEGRPVMLEVRPRGE
jgi:hypothetical protein